MNMLVHLQWLAQRGAPTFTERRWERTGGGGQGTGVKPMLQEMSSCAEHVIPGWGEGAAALVVSESRATMVQPLAKRILLVDDERSIRESLSKILRGGDCEVVLAENGPEALEKHGAERIDLLLLDLNLPIRNGWDSLQWLAEVNPLLPVVIITGRSDQRAVAEAAGADVLMEKPLDVPLLLQSVRELLKAPIESRAQHASSHAAGFRYEPCDNPFFREMRLKRPISPASIRCHVEDGEREISK